MTKLAMDAELGLVLHCMQCPYQIGFMLDLERAHFLAGLDGFDTDYVENMALSILSLSWSKYNFLLE